jgi:hypothetical protein
VLGFGDRLATDWRPLPVKHHVSRREAESLTPGIGLLRHKIIIIIIMSLQTMFSESKQVANDSSISYSPTMIFYISQKFYSR